MNQLVKTGLVSMMLVGTMVSVVPMSLAANTDPPRTGKISGRSVVAGALSLLIWPGIGQAVNSNKGDKIATHAVIGLLPPFRFWSGYDALVDRKGGYWNGRI
ncbi:MAG: hypothetical protein K0Q50_901 [Vampirovibrio sp.]|nr:hypothetical protein [Vampirovibrio sp.]